MAKSKKSLSSENINKDSFENKKPDGGYGWVILAMAFLISFILDGCMYSFGIVLSEIKDHYNVTQDVANLVPSLNVGFLFLSGPISSALAQQFGCRIVIMISALIFGLMYVASAFLPSIYFMIGTFGVIGGIAFGCTYLTCFIILVDYFDKKLGLANGITMAGSGLGAFAFAPFTNILIKFFGWKTTMIILGGLTLQCCLLGAFLRPVSHYMKKSKSHPVEMENLNKPNSDSQNHHEPVPEIKPKKPSPGATVAKIFKEMFNFKLIATNKLFLLIVLSNFFVFFVYFIPFIYIPIRAKKLGMTQYPWIISIIGIVNIPARIIFGILSDRGFMSAINMNTLCALVASAAVFSYYALLEFWMQAIFSVIFAIAIAGMNCLATPYIVDVVGSNNFSNANGILNMFRGFGCIVGPYIAGWLSETTGSSFYSFLFAGISFTMAFVFSGVISIKRLVEKEKI